MSAAVAVGATTALLEEIRARKDRDEEAKDLRAYKRSASRSNREQQELFDEGRREEREAAKAGRSTTRPKSGRSSSTRKKRPPASLRTAKRQLAAPVRAQTASALQAFGLSLGVVLLYQVLRYAPAVEGALGGLARGLEWFSAPDKSIPYAGSK